MTQIKQCSLCLETRRQRKGSSLIELPYLREAGENFSTNRMTALCVMYSKAGVSINDVIVFVYSLCIRALEALMRFLYLRTTGTVLAVA